MCKNEIKSGKKGGEVGRKQKDLQEEKIKEEKKCYLMLRRCSATTGESPELYQCTW